MTLAILFIILILSIGIYSVIQEVEKELKNLKEDIKNLKNRL